MYGRSDYVTAAGLDILGGWSAVAINTRQFLVQTVA